MNLATLKQVYRSPDLRRRVLTVLGLLIAFRFLAHVPVPVPDNAALANFLKTIFNSNKVLGFADVFSGGALANFSIIMMGVGPYINASIIVQLLTQVIPKLEALSKEGEQGRRKLNQYTRMLTLPLAIVESFGMVFLIQQTSQRVANTDLIGHPNLFQWLLMISTITAGTMLLMWIGEIITEKGIGNGISLIIFCGIISGLPASAGQFASLASGDAGKIITLIAFLAGTLGVIAFVVLLNEGARNIPVSYAKRARGSRIYAGIDTHLPLRVITAGVIPIIFALAFLSVPGLLGQVLQHAKTAWVSHFAQNLTVWFSPSGWIYAVSYFVLVVAFTYFYTSVVFNAKDIAENLQKQGGFIPGIRPGNQTALYLRRVINRITLAGAVGLGIIAVLPFIAEGFTKSQILTFGGTSLLIVVSVAIETLKQLEAQAITTSYEQY
ncbi:MAG: preprotein translocase subunit SecY, preprotein translocase subunit SecY [Patescibacteria group bacterium]|nr:preprotein translocase subunit SecY, preprotein translocase subunit SecY [Patescibacteria group bacterium]